MRFGIISAVLVASMGSALLVGCDKELNRTEKTTTDPNGNQSTVEQKTVQHPDGSVTTEKDVNNSSANH